MGSYILHSILLVTIISHHLVIVDSCSCLYQDPYEAICTSDAAVYATVVSTVFPEGIPDSLNEEYPVRYELDIHDIFKSPKGSDMIPNVVGSFLPGHLCGLSLDNDTSYVLAGFLATDTYRSGNQMLEMMLCSLTIYVSGKWGTYEEQLAEIYERIDCSNPPMYVRSEYERHYGKAMALKRSQQHKTLNKNEVDAAEGTEKRRDKDSRIKDFLNVFTGMNPKTQRK